MLKIFIADLTHTYIELASGTFPLGAAYVASYIKEVLGNEVDITLFKYPSELEERLTGDGPPAKDKKNINEKILIVSGGPNISKERHKQKKFLEDNPFVDFHILSEGEVAAAELLCRYADNNYCIESLKKNCARQSLSICNGEFIVGEMIGRVGANKNKPVELRSDKLNCSVSTLDDIPSPYMNGMMDKFFDNKLYPLIETNRGCPFACTFCQQGEDYFNSVAMRNIDKVTKELEYVAQKMVKESPGVARLEFADPNFAMFKQDMQTTAYLFKLQQSLGWPRTIGCSTGKNKPGQVIEAVEKVMPDSLVISNSMQSTNPDTLSQIKRGNISLGAYAQIQGDIQSRGLRSMADIILGLPHETKESHFSAIYSLIDSGVQEFTSYQAMFLKSTELEGDSSVESYGLVIKSRVVPRAMGKYRINNKVVYIAEAENIIVSTNTLSFEDYLSSRVLHFLAGVYHNSGVFDVIDYVLKKNKMSKSKIMDMLQQRYENRESKILVVLDQFVRETQSELFETEDECLKFYCNEKSLSRVMNSEIGANLIWKHIGLSLFKYWESVVDEIMICMNSLLEIDTDVVSDIRTYLLTRVVDISVEEIEASLSFKLKTEFISEYTGVCSEDKCFIVKISDEGCKSINHYKSIYNNNPNGWSLMLAMLRVHSFIRSELSYAE
jgi:hypothetical protein